MRRITILLFLITSITQLGCTALLFQPVKEFRPLPQSVLDNVQDYEFASFDGTQLHGWYLPSRLDPQQPEHTVLFLHGNAINVSSHIGGVFWMPDEGIEAYIFDYRGYGKSKGIPYLEGVLLDINAAIEYTLSQMPEDEKLWIVGHSVGASMGIYSVSQSKHKQRIAGYIAVSPFSDYRKITQEFLARNWITWMFQWPLSFFMNNDFSPFKYVQDIYPVPIYIIHGKQDDIISYEHSLKLYEKARQPKYLKIFEAKHNNIFAYPDVKQQIVTYLDEASVHMQDTN